MFPYPDKWPSTGSNQPRGSKETSMQEHERTWGKGQENMTTSEIYQNYLNYSKLVSNCSKRYIVVWFGEITTSKKFFKSNFAEIFNRKSCSFVISFIFTCEHIYWSKYNSSCSSALLTLEIGYQRLCKEQWKKILKPNKTFP